MLGIVGPPGAGKSTLATSLVAHLNASASFAAYVPMDGFHLANAQLAALGLASRKGHPSTFDVGGFVVALTRIRARAEVVYLPQYSRTLHEPLAAALAFDPSITLAIVEGNYLLLDEHPWTRVRPLLDEVWYLDASLETIRQRLVARQVLGGRTPAQAEAWVRESDLVNARLIEATKPFADRIIETS